MQIVTEFSLQVVIHLQIVWDQAEVWHSLFQHIVTARIPHSQMNAQFLLHQKIPAISIQSVEIRKYLEEVKTHNK